MSGRFFIDVCYWQAGKSNQPVSGDMFLSRKLPEEGRVISVLADGLGSGIKASVLATLTSSMALRFVASDSDLKQTAGLMMDILPVCRERKIGYSTFTIVDIEASGAVRVIEHDNPAYVLVRHGKLVDVDKESATIQAAPGTDDEREMLFSHLTAGHGDRLIIFSDGVSQSGMGQKTTPLGWGADAVRQFALEQVRMNPDIAARELARRIVQRAVMNDLESPKDDITCAVIHFRRPRRLLLVTGPPFSKGNDAGMASHVEAFSGRKVICGGTTASIIARELGRRVDVDLSHVHPEIPPTSTMEGIDLITEGTITLGRVAELLAADAVPEAADAEGNPAVDVLGLLLNSDIIHFLVGTRINEAHQDPNVPVELDIRRNIVKRIRSLLEEKHLKETRMQLI